MNRLPQGAQLITAVLAVALLSSGCATSTLWDEQSYHPSDRPGLNLALNPGNRDLLVEYQEQRAEAKKVRRRAYWLFASTNSIALRGKPVFVNPKEFPGLIPLRLLEETPSTNAPSMGGYVAVATPAQQGFDLWHDGELVGRYYLPIYLAKPNASVWRVAATPFAALGDTTVIIVVCGAIIAVVAGVMYADGRAH